MYSTSPRFLTQATDTLQEGDSPVPKRQRLLTDSTGKDETADVCTSLQIYDDTPASAPATSQSDMPSSHAATTQHARATLSPMVDEARVLSQSLCLITHHTNGCSWSIFLQETGFSHGVQEAHKHSASAFSAPTTNHKVFLHDAFSTC